MKRHDWVYAFLSMGLIIMCTLWILSENKNSTYEDYLSRVIADKAAVISSLPTSASGVIDMVLSDGTISKAQANELVESFWDLYREIQDLEGFAIQLGELQKDSATNHAQSVVYDLHSYMINLQAGMDMNEMTLTVQQKNQLENMKSQLQAYSTAVQDQLKFSSGVNDHPVGFYRYYLELGIIDEYWIKLLESYEEVSIID